jgi:transcriptional regulator with XRE-family HTH domain
MDRAALADFLRRHREALQPADVGIPVTARRRTPGLRREDVAALAMMSTDYYTRLEQQRGPQPSEQMLGSLARALRLTSDERDYLFQLAGHTAPAPAAVTAHVPPALLRVLDRLDDTPALILSNLGETLVQNRMAAALLGDQSGHTGPARSEIVRALQKASPEFAELWERHEVARRFEDHKVLIHPELGPIELDCQVLFTEDQSIALLVLTAPPRTEGYEKLQLLAVLGQERFADTGRG